MNGADFLKSKRITQTQLAEELKCARQNISQWFCGALSPSIKTIEKITNALNALGADTNYEEVFAVLREARIEREKKNA